MTEAELQAEVINLCHENKCLVFHCEDSRRNPGDPGFPDLVITGRRNIMFVELKSMTGSLTREQTDWHWSLVAAGAYWAVWKPKDLKHIAAVLREL